MCGIVGIIDTRIERIPSTVVARLSESMRSRGPDGFGRYDDTHLSIAMRRLSVVDREGGAQPKKNRSGTVVCFQNGEVYNHVELRSDLKAKGYVFETRSDTEVLVHGYEAWGTEGLLQRIDGMFAIAIYDKKKRRLIIARDRFGEKPLFYGSGASHFAFSSSMTALAQLEFVDSRIRPAALNYYLALEYVPGSYTILQGVERVLPGEYITIDVDSLKQSRGKFYSLPIRRSGSMPKDDLPALLEKSVQSRMAADVPVGLFLSGGLDSSLIASMMGRHVSGFHTFSIAVDSPESDESKYAHSVADVVKSVHHAIPFSYSDFVHLVPQVASVLDEPIGDQALVPLFLMCSKAKDYVIVVLSGEGADEIFCGYDYYTNAYLQKQAFFSVLKRRFSRKRLLDGNVTPSGFPLLSSGRERALLIGSLNTDIYEKEILSRVWPINDQVRAAQHTDLTTWLACDLLPKFDAMTMAHSLEGRAPYLHKDIVELGLGLSQKDKVSQHSSKIYLRKIAQDHLPQKIIERKKQGFVLPLADWLPRYFCEQGGIEPYFLGHSIPSLNLEQACHMIQQQIAHNAFNGRFAFALLLFMEWYSVFCKKTAQKICY